MEHEPNARVEWKKSLPLFRRFWPFMRPELRLAVVVTALLIIAIPAGVASPLLVKKIFDVALPGGDRSQFVRLGAVIVGLTLFAHALRLIASLVVVRLQNRVRFRLTRRLYEHVLRLPIRYFHQTETGYVMARVREDVQSLDAVMVDSLAHAGIDAVRAVIFFCLLFFIDAGLAISGILLLAVIFGGVIGVSKPLRRRNEAAQEADAKSSSALHQSISGIQTVRVGAQEPAERRRFGSFLKRAIRADVRRDVLNVSVSYIVGLAVALGMYVIIIVGAYRILIGASTFGNLMAFSMYLTYVGGAVTGLMSLNVGLQRAFSSLQRIFRMLDESAESPRTGAGAERLVGRVAFDRVSFAYSLDAPALADVSLQVAPGEVIAIVGRSGAGKSTLVNLIPRLFDPDEGEVRIDGRPVREYPLRRLRARIGVVPQDVFLFNRSIEENIAFARPGATRDDVVAAARAAHADVFIDRLEHGYETLVGERGVKLSGGEKQRIAIAREILRDPAILILDEATSSLDSESEALIKDAVDRLKKDRTCFVIAHRLSTILDADQIVVLDRGRVVERGGHGELMTRDGVYRRLYDTQFASVE